MKKNKIIFPVVLFMAAACHAQEKPIFELYDSAVVSRKIDKVKGLWYYGNSKKDTVIIKIDKIPMKLLYPGTDFTQHTTIAWLYYKKADTIKEAGLLTFFPDKYSIKNWIFTGTYHKHAGAVLLSYSDSNLNDICQVKIVPGNRRKLLWEIKYKKAQHNKNYDFYYPQKVTLRRMKKKFP